MKNCVICGGKTVSIGHSQGVEIFKCTNCGLGITDSKDMPDYSQYHRDATYLAENEQFKNIFSKRVNLILSFKRQGSVLDIGSSTGELLSLFKNRGWEVLGIEPSAAAASEALKRGIPTVNKTFEEFGTDQKFDVVILNHVLEHMANPLAILRKVKSLLKEEGIVLVDVPHFGGLAAKVKGAGWEYILPHEHLWHFTVKAFMLLLAKANLRVIYLETHSGVWGYGSPAKEVWQSLIGGKKRFFSNVATALPSFFISKLGLGSGLTVVVQKQ